MTTRQTVLFYLMAAACAAYGGNNVSDLERWATVSFFANYANVPHDVAQRAVIYCTGLSQTDTVIYLNNLLAA